MEMLRQRIWKLRILIWFTVTSLVSMTIVSVPVYACSTVLSAPLIVSRTLTPGSTLSIDITIADVEKLFCYEFWLYYNATVLTATSVSSYDPFTLPMVAPTINETAGWVYVAQSMPMGEKEGFSTVDPAPIAKIDFTVDGYGTSTLDLRNSKLADLPIAISHEVLDGYFSNVHISYELYIVFLAKYNDLLADYNTLNSTYHSLQTEYDDLNTEYNSLDFSYDSLQNSYQSLQNDYNDLNGQYEFLRGESGTFRNLIYIFATATIVLIGTTIYFAVKRPSQKA